MCAIAHGCATVQQSRYAELAGVPVALLGLAGYAAILVSLARDDEDWRTATAFLAIAGARLLRLAHLGRGRGAGRDLHLVRRLGGVHGRAGRLSIARVLGGPLRA